MDNRFGAGGEPGIGVGLKRPWTLIGSRRDPKFHRTFFPLIRLCREPHWGWLKTIVSVNTLGHGMAPIDFWGLKWPWVYSSFRSNNTSIPMGDWCGSFPQPKCRKIGCGSGWSNVLKGVNKKNAIVFYGRAVFFLDCPFNG